MSGKSQSPPRPVKQRIRRSAQRNRRRQENKERLSQQIIETCLTLPSVRRAKTLLIYLSVRDEVRTVSLFPQVQADTWKIVVPWCTETGDLELFALDSMDELQVGRFGILEPVADLRGLHGKQVTMAEIDAVLVPGVAFDRNGGRLGHGHGYYDRLLQHARSDCLLAGLAWDCQMFSEIPMDQHDVFMDCVVTETDVHSGRRSRTAI